MAVQSKWVRSWNWVVSQCNTGYSRFTTPRGVIVVAPDYIQTVSSWILCISRYSWRKTPVLNSVELLPDDSTEVDGLMRHMVFCVRHTLLLLKFLFKRRRMSKANNGFTEGQRKDAWRGEKEKWKMAIWNNKLWVLIIHLFLKIHKNVMMTQMRELKKKINQTA